MRYTILLILFSVSAASYAQLSIRDRVSPDDNGTPLHQLLSEYERKYNIDFITLVPDVFALTVTGVAKSKPILQYLEDLLYINDMHIIRVDNDIVFITHGSMVELYGSRPSNYLVIANDKIIRGRILDPTGEAIPGAQIMVNEKGTVSNLNGEFSIPILKEVNEIAISYIGFETQKYVILKSPLRVSTSLSFQLLSEPIQLGGVTITAKASNNNVESLEVGATALPIETIRELPAFMGEVDVVKSITTLPGVSTAGEMSSGFNVRGGDTGNNLIIQDGSFIYNPSHLFGFFSAFNPDLVSGIDLYKGGGPANFGGRTASVLNIGLKNGDAGKFGLKGGIGLISSRLTLDGPIVKGKSSFIIGGRISYVNWLIKALDNVQLQESGAQFRDLTGKVFHTINKNNFVSASFYNSFDNFQFNSDSTFVWKTNNLNLKWDHKFDDKFSSQLSFSKSSYKSDVQNHSMLNGFIYRTAIDNYSASYVINAELNENITSFIGLDGIYTTIVPGELDNLKGVATPFQIQEKNSFEFSLFQSNKITLSQRLSIEAGVRISSFHRLGSEDIYSYDFNDLDGRYPVIIDTTSYSKGEVIASFYNFEPRLSARYSINNALSLKASYYRAFQYQHLVSNTVSPTPQDFWLSSGSNLKPQESHQWSLGLFQNLRNNKYEFGIESYYKAMDNVIDFIEGADNTFNEKMEAGIIQGQGRAYGIESNIKKTRGRLNGWISYTFSKSLRLFDSDQEFYKINEGNQYPSAYDQPHNLTVVMNYKLSDYITLSSNFSYSTGRPITVPLGSQSYEHYISVLNYSGRNEFRIPDYHRLDLSITLKDKYRQNKKFYGEWVIGIYNVYGRKNAYSVFFNGRGTAYKMSIMGSVFPSITYNFKL